MAAPHLWASWGHGWPTLPGGTVLAAGGLDGTGALLSSAEIYDPVSGAFAATGPLHTAVISMFPVTLSDQSVLYIGGWNSTTGSPPTPGWQYTGSGTSEVQRYSPASGTFADTGPLAESRLAGCNVVLPNGSVLAIGGATGSASSEANIEQFLLASNQWTTLGTLTTVPTCGQAFPLPNGKILMVATGSSENTDLLDPTALTTTPVTGFPTGWTPYFIQLQSGDVLAYGGPLGTATASTMAMVYSAAKGAWTSVGALNRARGGSMSATLLTTGDVLIAGGSDAANNQLASAEVYHP
jgi:hypothetical protein